MKCDKNEMINMTRAWDKEEIWVPDGNRIHDLPNTGRGLYPLSCENAWRARPFKGATSRYFLSFLGWPKLRLKCWETKNTGLLRKKNTKGAILEQKGTRMAEDGEDWNGLEMTILKSLAKFFKIHKRWRSSFNWVPIYVSGIVLGSAMLIASIAMILEGDF